MDKCEAVKIAERYIHSINNHFLIESAFLLGSFAKGTNRPDSDIDLAIVFKNVEDIIDLQVQLMQLISDVDLLI